jgi:transposase
MDRFWLTDAQFAKIAPHLPTDTRGKQRVDDRRVISGIAVGDVHGSSSFVGGQKLSEGGLVAA